MKIVFFLNLFFFSVGFTFAQNHTVVEIDPNLILNDVSNKPIGINVNYLMDDDYFLKPKISLAETLKKMGVKYLRYPGGNKSDFYFFSKPPYNKSEPTLARTGKKAVAGRFATLNESCTGFKFDPLDFDEFMLLCKQINAEPIIVVAADEYLVNYPAGTTWSTKEQLVLHAREWVNYANIKKKYGIKYWMIGNESWHETNKNSNAQIYAQDIIDFSKAMKSVDSSISIIPNGNNKSWWDTVFTNASNYFDAVCVSNYPVYNYANGFDTYRDSTANFTSTIEFANKAILKYIPVSKQDKFKIIVAEFGPFDWSNKWPHINNMGLCMANFEIIGQQLLEPKIDFSCFWNTRWMNNQSDKIEAYDAIDRNGNINTIGNSLLIWLNYLGNKMVKTTAYNPLKTFASISKTQKKVYLYIINKSDKAVSVNTKFKSSNIYNPISISSLVGKNENDQKPIWTSQKLNSIRNSDISVPPISISVLIFSSKK